MLTDSMLDDGRYELVGSPSRDTFKRRHKDMPPQFYALDIDLVLIDRAPFMIVAFCDYKRPTDNITFAEVVAYNDLLKVAQVYIIEAGDPQNGPYTIMRYLGGDPRPHPPKVEIVEECRCTTFKDLETWEREIRQEIANDRMIRIKEDERC